MWVVFGSGDEFARILIEEVDAAAPPHTATPSPAASDDVEGEPPAGRRAATAAEDAGPVGAQAVDPDAALQPMVLINIGSSYRPDMDAAALYEVTRGVWRIGADKRRKVRYALAVADGEVREAYRVDAWHEAGSTPYATRRADALGQAGRWEFTGEVAPHSAREALVGLIRGAMDRRPESPAYLYVGNDLEGNALHTIADVLEEAALGD